MAIEVQYGDAEELVAAGDYVIIRIVDGQRSTTADFDRLVGVLDSALGDVPLVGYIQIVRQGTPPLQPEVRRHVAEIFDTYSDRVVGVIVLLGLGFWTKSYRLAMRAFNSLLRRSHVHVAGTVEGGFEILANEMIGLNAEELMQTYARLSEDMAELR